MTSTTYRAVMMAFAAESGLYLDEAEQQQPDTPSRYTVMWEAYDEVAAHLMQLALQPLDAGTRHTTEHTT